MIVKIIKTGEVLEVNDSYGLRLIEQGIAAPATIKCKAEIKPTEAPAQKKGKGR